MSTSKDNIYRIHYEPVDIKAAFPEEARRKVKYVTPDVNKIIVINKNGFPLTMVG